MASTIAEFFIRRWVEENLPGVKIQIEGRGARLTDSNGDSMCIAFDPESKVLFVSTHVTETTLPTYHKSEVISCK